MEKSNRNCLIFMSCLFFVIGLMTTINAIQDKQPAYEGWQKNPIIIAGLNYDPVNEIYKSPDGRLWKLPLDSLPIGQQIIIKAQMEDKLG